MSRAATVSMVTLLDAPGGDSDSVRSPVRLAALRASGLLRSDIDRGDIDRSDIDHLLDRLTKLAASLIGAPIALISMVDEDRQYFTSMHGLDEPLAARRETALSHSVCRTVVQTAQPLVLDELAESPDFADHPARRDLDVKSYCGVPIRDPEGHVLGSFCVIDDQRHVWTQTTVDTLTQLASIVTDVVATAQDYSRLVHDLQGRLLPPTLPPHPGGRLRASYRPVAFSDDIGGDFYDAFVHSSGEMDVVLCDVVGHGITSTHAAAQLRAATRAVLTGVTRDTSEVINRVSQACADLPGCDTAAMLVARISADGHTVSWSRAGAMPPVRTGALPELRRHGACPPIGIGSCEFDPMNTVHLEPGEGLLLYTDGLTERRGRDLDVGLEQLCRLSAETADLDDLIEACCPLRVQTDDIAVVSWTRSG